MRQEKIFDFRKVGELIAEYYKDPDRALQRVFKSKKVKRGDNAVPDAV